MKNKTYWQSRLTSVDDEAYTKSEKYIADVRKQYQKAISNMEKDIAVWYQRVADNNEISYSAARKLLKANELEEFKWTVEDYIKAGQENAFDQRWMKELENASARVHISRLEAMKLQLRQHAEQLAAQLNVGLTDLLGDVYENQFYRNAFEISRAFGVGSDLGRINTRRIDTVLRTPWMRDGKVFSERIWADRDKLANELHEVLSQGTIRGTSPQKMARDLAKRMDVSRAQAERLILTETAAISARSKYDTYKELGVEEFQISVTLDSRTCETCRPFDGLHFPLSQYVIGETVPPFHPRCRCSTVPYFDDEFTEDEMRAARDANDQGYELVPANMTYQEWKQTFVKGALSSIAGTVVNGIIELSHEELHALNRYLSSESYTLNDKLRRGEKLSEEEEQWITNLDAALDKMPEYEGTVYRSVSEFGIDDVNAFINSHVIGKVIKIPSYTSSSDTVYDEIFPIQYVIRSKHGKNIQKYNESEREILFKRNSSFRVVNISGNTIYMEEL